MSLKPNKFSVYLTKNIFKFFFIIFFGLVFLFFVVDFFEISNSIKGLENGLEIGVKIVLFRIPSFLERILYLIVLLSSLFTFYNFSNNSEITIMRASGKSIFSIIKFSAFVAFLLGIFVVVFYNSISSYLNTESKRLTNLYLKGKNENFLESKNGIWFKQNNLKDNSGIIIIRASSAHKKELIFNDVILFYLDKNNNFLKRINTKTLTLNNNSWTAVDNYIIQNGEKSKFIKNIDISTNLNRNFIIKMIRNEYESEYNVYFLNLASSIKDLESSGFNTLKFKVRFYSLLFTPFLFSIMILISAYFGIVSSRENKKYLSLIKGITMGFIVFVSHTLIIEFANASKLTILDSSFFIVLIFVLLSVVLIMKKDLLSNYS